jgi:hypothetical protein
MEPERRYETQRIDHLGINAGICYEIGLIETIDQQVGPGGQQVSCRQGVQAMVLNALGFSSGGTKRSRSGNRTKFTGFGIPIQVL